MERWEIQAWVEIQALEMDITKVEQVGRTEGMLSVLGLALTHKCMIREIVWDQDQ